jgi:multidrug efflux pump
MIGVTLFGIFLTPVFYSVVRRFSGSGPAGPGTGMHVAAVPEPEPEPAGSVLDASDRDGEDR